MCAILLYKIVSEWGSTILFFFQLKWASTSHSTTHKCTQHVFDFIVMLWFCVSPYIYLRAWAPEGNRMKFIFIIHSEGKCENAFSTVALVDTILCSYCVELYGFAHFTTIKCNKIKSMPCTMHRRTHTLSLTNSSSSNILLLRCLHLLACPPSLESTKT